MMIRALLRKQLRELGEMCIRDRSTGAFVVVPEENEKSEPFSNRK